MCDLMLMLVYCCIYMTNPVVLIHLEYNMYCCIKHSETFHSTTFCNYVLMNLYDEPCGSDTLGLQYVLVLNMANLWDTNGYDELCSSDSFRISYILLY